MESAYGTAGGWKFRVDYENGKVIGLSIVKDDKNPAGVDCALSTLVFQQLKEYFAGQRKKFDFPIEMRGTPFQKKVWEALCKIPYGETRTYKEIAIAVGNEKACRAVGMANHNNHIIIAVPCHRVIGANGKLVGYGGGLDVKATLLKLEKDHCNMV